MDVKDDKQKTVSDDDDCSGCCGGGCGEEAEAKAEEYLAGWKRAIADYQNREKDLAREKQEIAAYARENAVLDFLPVLDNLRQAFTHVPDDQREVGWVKGVEYIVKQFEDTLAKNGFKRFVSLGAKFNPARHEAVGEADGEAETIVSEISPGYTVNERVVVPARVVVGVRK